MQVEGMTCDHCEQVVERAVEREGASKPDAEPVLGSEDGDFDYDLVAIGAGSAAFAAAIRATNLGGRVALVERDTVGGTCVNVGCIPSKNLLAAAEAYRQAAHNPFPIDISRGRADMGALVRMKEGVVSMLRKGKYLDLAQHYGFELIEGEARFTGPDVIEVDGREIRAARYVIATGSAPWMPPIEGLDDAGYLTSTTAMELEEVPESVVVIGGNYIGLEMGQLLADLGAKVTIVEALDRIAPLEEPEVSDWMTRILAEQGIEVLAGATVARVERGNRKAVVVEAEGVEHRLEAAELLVATGRRPVLAGLGLDEAEIELDERGRLMLGGDLRTTNPRVFAAGDVTGAPQFVYVAAAQGTLAAENALSNAGRRMDYRALPRVTFTSPNIAAVGLTDAQARQAGFDCECRTLELEHVPRAIVNLDTRGAVKVVAEKETGRVLGVHAIAHNAGDLILAGVYAVKFGLTVQDLADTWAPYLTMSEAVKLTAQTFTADVEKLSCCAA
jgi:mercuric reductase